MRISAAHLFLIPLFLWESALRCTAKFTVQSSQPRILLAWNRLPRCMIGTWLHAAGGKDGRMIYKHFKRRSCDWKSPIECLVSCLSECFNVGQCKVSNRALGSTALKILLEKRVSRHTFAELCLIFEATQLRKTNTSKGAVSQQVQKTRGKENLCSFNTGRMTAGQRARLYPGLQVAMCPRG